MTKPFYPTHHSCNNPINAAEKRDRAPRIRLVYQKLIESERWDAKKDNKWKQPMISYLREGWVRKSLVVKQEPSGWKLCLWTSTCQSQNMARDEWSSQLEVDCFDGGRWCRQRSIYACKYGCKICDEFFWDQNIHQQNCIQQSTRETDNVASGPKDSYLLEGNWIASDKIPECLQSRQSARTGFAIKDHNTIRSREHLQWTEWINNTNSVLTSFFISLHPSNTVLEVWD